MSARRAPIGIAVMGLMALAMALIPSIPALARDVVLNFIVDPPTVLITARVGSLSSLESLSAEIKSDDPSIPPFRETRQGDFAPYGPWEDYDEIDIDTSLLYNGTYRIEAKAASSRGHRANGSRTVKVNNPPRPPARVSAGLEGGTPVVRWNTNPEPDMLRYRVDRAPEGGPFAPAGTLEGPTTTTFRDAGAPKGVKLSYQVVAIRRSPVDPAGIASAASRAPQQVVIPAAPPPRPTTTQRPTSTTTPAPPPTTTTSTAPAPEPSPTPAPSPTATPPPGPDQTPSPPEGDSPVRRPGNLSPGRSPEPVHYQAGAIFLFLLGLVILWTAQGLFPHRESIRDAMSRSPWI